MREIRFRGRQMDFPTGKDNGKWAFGYLVRQLDMGEYERWWITNDWDGVENFEVIPESIGQYTGLKDKNGKEIYEGDFVKFTFDDEDSCMGSTYEEVYLVKWNERLLQFEFSDEKYYPLGSPVSGKHTLWSMNHLSYETEIIGNIYENPELLEANNAK